MQRECRHQGEIIHLLASDGFIQIIIQGVDRETRQVQLRFTTPNQVSLVGCHAHRALVSERILDLVTS